MIGCRVTATPWQRQLLRARENELILSCSGPVTVPPPMRDRIVEKVNNVKIIYLVSLHTWISTWWVSFLFLFIIIIVIIIIINF